MRELKEIFGERTLILDGAMGTMIQRLGADGCHEGQCCSGNNDALCLTHANEIAGIHRQYLEAGADIISTNSFNANAISQKEYGLEEKVRELNLAAARVARSAADAFMAAHPGREVWVAGSIGPTNRTASMSPDVADPGARNVTFDELRDAYRTQIAGLRDGGVDLLLFETAFDTLNLKAGLHAAALEAEESGKKLPVMVSVTVADKAGRTLSGQTLDALAATVENFDSVVSLGLNCSFGPEEMEPHLLALAEATTLPLSCHPNAGLPDELGEYALTPERFAPLVARMAERAGAAVVGGCCGTTPEHIRLLAEELKGKRPDRKATAADGCLHLAGLERLDLTPGRGFVNIGERCNVAGSRKFLRLIKEGNLAEALDIARRQVEDGALVLDINMDDAMLDAPREMARFLDLLGSDPDIARVPLMIDSSDPAVYLEALRHVQGRSIVNSISLKEGEEKFLGLARKIRSLGAAVVVMAFDEEGQADTFARKTEICGRAYRLLTEKAGFRPEEIIFDPNIMAVATGMPEHDRYGIDYIEAVRWIKRNLPGALTSGGVSNLSFSFRGHNRLREAMHAVFLYHAIEAGLDMAILNPATSVTYADIEPSLRELLERVVLAKDPEAPEELAAYAAAHADEKGGAKATAAVDTDTLAPRERLVRALVKGDASHLEEDLDAQLADGVEAVDIIQGPLMEGMTEVGRLFGEGKMFLPQVIKTARTMKLAVDRLRPFMEKNADAAAPKAGKILFATVKGDVHDIGKNIVSIVLGCNNFEVVDLGVMVPAQEIAGAVRRENPDIVCLSGLITPSLGEMAKVAATFEGEGFRVPLIVGGATTSALHTALRIAPGYSAPVVHATDASSTPLIAAALLEAGSEAYVTRLRAGQEALRRDYARRTEEDSKRMLTGDEAFARRLPQPEVGVAVNPEDVGRQKNYSLTVGGLEPLVNWKSFLHVWRMAAGKSEEKENEAAKLLGDARAMLAELAELGPVVDGRTVMLPASSDGHAITLGGRRLPMARQRFAEDGKPALSLADYVAENDDHAGVFAVTTSPALRDAIAREQMDGDDYRFLLIRTLADRLVEAGAEYLHRVTTGGPADSGHAAPPPAVGIRPAVGYPSMPDQRLIFDLAALVGAADLGITLTENGAMLPQASVMGLHILDPRARYFLI